MNLSHRRPQPPPRRGEHGNVVHEADVEKPRPLEGTVEVEEEERSEQGTERAPERDPALESPVPTACLGGAAPAQGRSACSDRASPEPARRTIERSAGGPVPALRFPLICSCVCGRPSFCPALSDSVEFQSGRRCPNCTTSRHFQPHSARRISRFLAFLAGFEPLLLHFHSACWTSCFVLPHVIAIAALLGSVMRTTWTTARPDVYRYCIAPRRTSRGVSSPRRTSCRSRNENLVRQKRRPASRRAEGVHPGQAQKEGLLMRRVERGALFGAVALAASRLPGAVDRRLGPPATLQTVAGTCRSPRPPAARPERSAAMPS